MADNNYVENRDILQVSDLGEEVLVPIDIATRYNVGSWSDLERKYLVAKSLFPIPGTYTPTITDEINLVASLTNLRYIDTGGLVQIFGDVRVDLDGGATSGSFKFDLATAIQPANNWSVSEDVGAVLHRNNGLFTNPCTITADTGGSKLLIGTFADTTAGATIKATFIITYNKNN